MIPALAFSTTRFWNPGDELIFLGVSRLLEESLGSEFTSVIWDRSPVAQAVSPKMEGEFFGKTNSLASAGGERPEFALGVFAGTPEWYGRPVRPFVRAMSQTPMIHLGVGSVHTEKALRRRDVNSIRRSVFLSARDVNARNLLRSYTKSEVHLWPCPGCFAFDAEVVDERNRMVGVCWQSAGCPPQLVARTGDLVEALRTHPGVDVEVITHSVLDYSRARKRWPSLNVRFSDDPQGLAEIYRQAGSVISTRLHGSILALSVGVPALQLFARTGRDPSRHSVRVLGACDQIEVLPALELTGEISEAVAAVEKMVLHNRERSLKIHRWQRQQMLSQIDALSQRLSEVM